MYLTEAYEGYSKSLTQVDEFLEQQETQLAEAKVHRATMVSKIEDLAEMIGIDTNVEAKPILLPHESWLTLYYRTSRQVINVSSGITITYGLKVAYKWAHMGVIEI